ncbi:hypothetical protein BVG19_g929 [[Candida] boidinii]|nr:hypothetical protein BVG19_g929 [[Candida] boidinii]OWB50606.1 hypothetical protein B5S27_g2157 [[Candida] boidinii]
MVTWTPLPSLVHGKIIKPFLPLDEITSSTENTKTVLSHFRNCYPGDNCYIFEKSDDGQWGRGYIISQLLPSDYSSTVVSIDKLNESKISVCIIPYSYMRVIESFDLPSSNGKISENGEGEVSDSNSNNGLVEMPSLLESENVRLDESNGHIKPSIPFIQNESNELLYEVSASLKTITVYIYSLYCLGEFSIVDKLTVIYDQLDDIRVSLTHNLCTKFEADSAQRTASLLMGKVSKFLATRSKINNKLVIKDQKKSSFSGYDSIMSRDSATGELFDGRCKDPSLEKINFAKVVINQTLFALAPNFPISDFDVSLAPVKNNKLTKSAPSHILVDFKSVSGTSTILPKGYDGMTAFMYLRNSKRRLTEAFAITIRPDQELLLDTLSAALFTNIPATEIDNSRIYLVALLTEDIKLDPKTQPAVAGTNGIPPLNRIRKGVAAGVCDISRTFSRRKGSLAAGEAHQFVIKLFGSFTTSKQHQPHIVPGVNSFAALAASMPNNGWGELVDRIISGSSKGVAINPRAEQLVVSIKEFKNDILREQEIMNSETSPISQIGTMQFDPLSALYERCYLKLVKVNVSPAVNSSAPKYQYITVHVSTGNENIKFAKGANIPGVAVWPFLSVSPDEHVGETIQVYGFDSCLQGSSAPTTGTDYLIATCYCNGEYFGEGKIVLRKGNVITNTRKGKIELIGAGGAIVGNCEIEIDYTGNHFNTDGSVDTVLRWKNIYEKNLVSAEKNLISTLQRLNKVDALVVMKYFPELVLSLIEICDGATTYNLPGLQKTSFESLVHLLDIVIARHEEYVHLFDSAIEKYGSVFPAVGAQILNMLSEVYANVSKEWNSLGRSICRVCVLVLRLSIKCLGPNDEEEFRISFTRFASSVTAFLSSNEERIVADQLLVLEILEQWICDIRPLFPDENIVQFVISWLDAVGLRGLGSIEDVHGNALVNKKKTKERKIIMTKLILVRRLLYTELITSKTSVRETLVANCFRWGMEVACSNIIDIDAVRLAIGVLVSIVSTAFGKERLYIDNSKAIIIILARSLGILCARFQEIYKYCRTNNYFNPKRTFTQLFPITYPFPDFTIDSIINDEVFVDVLIEFSTLIMLLTTVAETLIPVFNHGILTGKFTIPLPPAYDCVDKYLVPFETFFNGKSFEGFSQLLRIILQGHFYPRDKWIVLSALFAKGTLSGLRVLQPIIQAMNIPDIKESDKFDRVMWSAYLKALLSCATGSTSSIEHLVEIARKACFMITGDIRTTAADMLEEVWDKLAWDGLYEDVSRFHLQRFGGYQVEFIINQDLGIIHELLLFCLQRNDRCLKVGVKMLWSILVSEWVMNESLFDIERECIVALYDIFHNSKYYTPQAIEIKAFITELKMTIKIDPEDEAYKSFVKFVETLSDFFSILIELNSIPLGIEYDDDRTFYKLAISGYLMKVNKPELLQSFINDMYENNLSKRNYVQASLSLELLANTYDWDLDTLLPASVKPKFPAQSAFHRKEALYKLMASNFIRGKKLEQAVDTYQELLDCYYKINFDLKSLSYCHGKLSEIYNELEHVDRLEPVYFKISFMGYGFPDSIRGKDFIYEGLPFEHITSIHDRLCGLYPGARIVQNENEAANMMSNTPFGKYLFIKTVEQQKDLSNTFSKASLMTKSYVDHKDLNTFVSTRRLPGSSSIVDLWTEETTYETILTFPTLMNRSEIKETRIVKVSPLENALRSLTDKNRDLATIEFTINQMISEQAINIVQISSSAVFNDLSRQLAGTVDSPVNGGVGQYRQFFKDLELDPTTPTNAKSTESEAPADATVAEGISGEAGESEAVEVVDPEVANIRLLKSAFNDMVILLNRCLHIHGKLIPIELKKSHETLVELFKKNFIIEIEELELTVEDNSVPTSYESKQMNAIGGNFRLPGSSHGHHHHHNGHHHHHQGGHSDAHSRPAHQIILSQQMGGHIANPALPNYAPSTNASSTFSDHSSSLSRSITTHSYTSDNSSGRLSASIASHNSGGANNKRTVLNWRNRF